MHILGCLQQQRPKPATYSKVWVTHNEEVRYPNIFFSNKRRKNRGPILPSPSSRRSLSSTSRTATSPNRAPPNLAAGTAAPAAAGSPRRAGRAPPRWASRAPQRTRRSSRGRALPAATAGAGERRRGALRVRALPDAFHHRESSTGRHGPAAPRGCFAAPAEEVPAELQPPRSPSSVGQV